MEKYVLNFIIKIVLFCTVMLLVAWLFPYGGLVNRFMREHVTLSMAEKIGYLILGEPDPEPYDSIRFYISLMINILISVPLFSFVTTAINMIRSRVSTVYPLKEYFFATLRRFYKIVLFTFLFWVVFRILPYQTLFPAHAKQSTPTLMIIIGFNLWITGICYWAISKKLTLKSSL